MLKITFFLGNLQISRADNTKSFRIKNAKCSFILTLIMQRDFQVCLSVPLRAFHFKYMQKLVYRASKLFRRHD